MGETLQLEPVDATFGAVVRGVELRSLDDATWRALHGAWLEYGLLIFPGQFLTRDEQNAFANRFGDLEFAATAISNMGKDGKVHHVDGDDVVKALRGNEGWHHDSTYMPVQAKGAVFTAEIVPTEGAATGFADMAAAYDALDDDTKALIADLSAYHSLNYSQGRVGYLPSKKTEKGDYAGYGYDQQPYLRPLVKVHPDTGRPNLLVGRHAFGVVGHGPRRVSGLVGPPQRLRLPVAPHLPPRVGSGRCRGLGQPPTDAPGDAVRHDPTPPYVAHPHRRRTQFGAGRERRLSEAGR